jgi:hypothetical protein
LCRDGVATAVRWRLVGVADGLRIEHESPEAEEEIAGCSSRVRTSDGRRDASASAAASHCRASAHGSMRTWNPGRQGLVCLR